MVITMHDVTKNGCLNEQKNFMQTNLLLVDHQTYGKSKLLPCSVIGCKTWFSRPLIFVRYFLDFFLKIYCIFGLFVLQLAEQSNKKDVIIMPSNNKNLHDGHRQRMFAEFEAASVDDRRRRIWADLQACGKKQMICTGVHSIITKTLRF